MEKSYGKIRSNRSRPQRPALYHVPRAETYASHRLVMVVGDCAAMDTVGVRHRRACVLGRQARQDCQG